MNIIRNFKLLKENLVLLILAALIGLIVSAVAQLFMIVARNLFIFIFKNKDFVLTFEIGSFSLNLIPLLICIPSSILVALRLEAVEDSLYHLCKN